jgi:hypothetical protein
MLPPSPPAMRTVVAVLAVASVLSSSGCRSGEGGQSAAPVAVADAEAGARTSSFRDIGKRSASDLNLR